MTRRRRNRRSLYRHPVIVAAAVIAGLIVIAAFGRYAFSVLALGAVVAGIIYVTERRARPAARSRAATRPRPPATVPPAAPSDEHGRLAAELVSVRAELARVQASLGEARTTAGAEIRRLRGQLADANAALSEAQASAQAAWDAAADRPPSRRVTGDTAPLDVLDAEQLAARPMSGARRIGHQ